jgi:hypothetical protein
MKKKQNRKIIIICIAALALFVGVIVLFSQCGNKNAVDNKNDKENSTQKATLSKEDEEFTPISPEELESMTIQVEVDKDYVEPDKNTLNINKIAGFTQKKNNEAGNSNAPKSKKNKKKQKDTTSKDAEKVKFELSDENLTIESVGSYMGNYVEDGSDEPTKDVAAIVITNHSKKMLQVGDITYQVTKKDKAEFRVTNLLPGMSALVLEKNKRPYKEKDDYSYGTVVNAYLDNPTLKEDMFKLTKENGKLLLENKTDKDYKKIYVYYKYTQIGGAFFGGITYRVPFEDVKAGTKVESIANHYNKNTSKIVDVQIAQE